MGYLTMVTLEVQQTGLLTVLLRWPIPLGPDLDSATQVQPNTRSHAKRAFDRIACWYLRYQIQRQCRYTSRIMKRLGCFESHLEAQLRQHPKPPTIERLRLQFLASLQNHQHPVLRAVARLDLARIALDCAEPVDTAAPTTIYWDRNPNKIMDALDRGSELPSPEPGVRYVLRMGPKVPNGAACVRQLLRA